MALRGILPEDYTNKGIRTKSNPLGLQVSEAQRAFDELSLDVIIPAVNKIVEEQNLINETIQPKEEGKVLSSNDFTNEYKQQLDALPEDLEKKVDKEEGKALSANDFTDEYKQTIDNLPNVLNTKVDKEEGKGLSSNDYTSADKQTVNVLTTGLLEGKKLSSNDFTNEDKNILSNTVTTDKVLVKGNEEAFTPTKPYDPVTKEYVDKNVISGGVPSSRKINGYELSSDVNLKASDVGAVSTNIFNTTVEGINTTVNSIGNRTTTLETTINSLVNGEAVQY